MKKNDYCFMAGTLVLALAGWAGSHFLLSEKGTEIIVSRNGKQIGAYSLSENQRLTFSDDEGRRNVLVIQEGRAYMEAADCPDGLCVKHKAISDRGESIICLPHRLSAEVSGGSEGTDAVVR